MLVLEKKQPQGTWQGQAETRNDLSDKQPAASELSEPNVPYNSAGDHSEKFPESRINNDINEPGQGGAPFNDQGTGQNEDDLPF